MRYTSFSHVFTNSQILFDILASLRVDKGLEHTVEAFRAAITSHVVEGEVPRR